MHVLESVVVFRLATGAVAKELSHSALWKRASSLDALLYWASSRRPIYWYKLKWCYELRVTSTRSTLVYSRSPSVLRVACYTCYICVLRVYEYEIRAR